MSLKSHFICLLSCFITVAAFAQKNWTNSLDSLLAQPSSQSFNGKILVAQGDNILYSKTMGFANLSRKTPFKENDQFVIGSISKQITAVLILQQVEKGHVKLQQPIRKYLPKLTQLWADTVTVHHLLTHTHGIVAMDQALAFRPGSQYDYSQIGYQLLADILEKVTGQPFAKLSANLFKQCGMKNSAHPDLNKGHLVKGWYEAENGEVKLQTEKFSMVAAGGFISTPKDLLIWNQHLFGGKLLKSDTYQTMITKQKNATRNHPLFGVTDYGYGITVDTKDDIFQLGQTGFAPGFASMNFYFPDSKTSVIVTENITYDKTSLNQAFFYHQNILNILRKSSLITRQSAAGKR